MSSFISLSTELLQEMQSHLSEACELKEQYQSLLSSFKEKDKDYAKVFVKHIGDDAQLRGAYAFVCDLRANAMNDHESEVLSALNKQSAAIQQCLERLNESIFESAISVDSECDTSVSIKVECNESQNEEVHRHQIEDIDKRKRERSDIISIDMNSVDMNDQPPCKRRRIEVMDPRLQIQKDAKEQQEEQQELEEGQLKESVIPNISGVWVYPADSRFKLILQEESESEQVVGLMVKSNETQCKIEGHREVEPGGGGGGKLYFRLCKLLRDGQRPHYSLHFGSDSESMNITKDGSTQPKALKLDSKQIPIQFLNELRKQREEKDASDASHEHSNKASHSMLPYHRPQQMKVSLTHLGGLWESTGSGIRCVLFEDFKNGNVIGFMQHDNVTKSTITGKKVAAKRYQLEEKMNDTRDAVCYDVTLLPGQRLFEMRKTDENGLSLITMKLCEKFIPQSLFRELETLKRVENYDGYRHRRF